MGVFRNIINKYKPKTEAAVVEESGNKEGEPQEVVAQSDQQQNSDEQPKKMEIETINLFEENSAENALLKQVTSTYRVSETEDKVLEEIDRETRERAEALMKREEEKIRQTANLIIDLQITKLESKLAFLEEYEKVLLQESKQHEMYQKMIIADKIHFLKRKLESSKTPAPTAVPVQNQPQVQSQPQAQAQNTTQNQAQPLFENRDPAYFGFNYSGGNINSDDLFNMGNPDTLGDFSGDNF